jgi:hypothetical protein
MGKNGQTCPSTKSKGRGRLQRTDLISGKWRVAEIALGRRYFDYSKGPFVNAQGVPVQTNLAGYGQFTSTNPPPVK